MFVIFLAVNSVRMWSSRAMWWALALLITLTHGEILGYLDPQKTAATCNSLLLTFPNLVTESTVSSESYKEQSEAHWSETAWKAPVCIISPISTNEVQTTIGQLVASNTTFAIRSGGHTPHPFWASTNHGVLISLSNLNDVIFDNLTDSVTVGAGARWGQVYDYLSQYGRTPVGGRASTVGVGGYMIGGGLSHFSAKYGLAIDNVLNMEVVLGNATVINANAHENPDLFWALKGGSNNFGVVTYVTLKTYPIGLVWGGVIEYPMSQYENFTDALSEYQKLTVNLTEGVPAILPYAATNRDLIIVTYFYSEPVAYPDALAPFWKLRPIEGADFTAVQPYSTFTNSTADTQGITRALTVYYDPEFYQIAMDILRESGEMLSSLDGGTMLVIPQPISSSVARVPGSSPLNIQSRDQLWLNVNVGWLDSEDDEEASAIAKNATDTLKAAAKQRGLLGDFLFMNDADRDQDVFAGYGEVSIARLRNIATAYDPHNVFTVLVPGGYKLLS